MTRRLRALIIQHEAESPPGLLGDWLDQQRAETEVLRMDLEVQVPDVRRFDLIASLGSELASFDDSVAFVGPESQLLRDAVHGDIPVLGLCFGAQLLARALGGMSFRAPRPEIGWLSVRSKDPDLVSTGPWLDWHHDSFGVPPGGRLIAETDACPQAYLIGRSLGLQFHPEVTPEIVGGWVRSARDAGDGEDIDLDALLAETHRRAPEARHLALHLFDRFASTVALQSTR